MAHDLHEAQSSLSLIPSPHFDVVRDLSQNRCAVADKLHLIYIIKKQNAVIDNLIFAALHLSLNRSKQVPLKMRKY